MGNGATEQSRLTPSETRDALELFNWSAGLRTFYDSVCGGTTFVFVAFALSLGLPKERMGLITSVASVACVAQMLSLALTNYVRDKKAFVLSVGLAEPVLVIAMVLSVPFLPRWMRLGALAGAVFFAAASLHLTRPMADNWVATVIPAGLRGRYLGRRFQAISACTIISTLIAGYVAERVDKSNSFGLGCILAVGGLFGIFSILALRGASMPALSFAARVSRRDLVKVFRSTEFRQYLYGTLIYNIPFTVAVPYYQVFNLRVLQMRESVIALMMSGYFVTKILTTPVLGRYADRKGARWTMFLFAPIYAAFFAMFVLSVPGRIWPVVVAWTVVGMADGAYGVALTSALYATVPSSLSRPAYFAVANLATIGIFAIGSLAAIPILHALRGVSLSVGPLVLGQFHCFYGLCALAMVGAAFGAGFMPARREARRSCGDS